mmetsp:Transcript_11144/g.35151  ORF Transcript_11144/g.35151 Transcript_11144/m.35151 type:complete len:378 (+) Transcript_11144:579-1712(+)
MSTAPRARPGAATGRRRRLGLAPAASHAASLREAKVLLVAHHVCLHLLGVVVPHPHCEHPFGRRLKLLVDCLQAAHALARRLERRNAQGGHGRRAGRVALQVPSGHHVSNVAGLGRVLLDGDAEGHLARDRLDQLGDARHLEVEGTHDIVHLARALVTVNLDAVRHLVPTVAIGRAHVEHAHDRVRHAQVDEHREARVAHAVERGRLEQHLVLLQHRLLPLHARALGRELHERARLLDHHLGERRAIERLQRSVRVGDDGDDGARCGGHVGHQHQVLERLKVRERQEKIDVRAGPLRVLRVRPRLHEAGQVAQELVHVHVLREVDKRLLHELNVLLMQRRVFKLVFIRELEDRAVLLHERAVHLLERVACDDGAELL